MILFGFEHQWGSVFPSDNEVRRILILGDKKNNLLVWRGYDSVLTEYTISSEDINEIESLTIDQELAPGVDKLEKENLMAYDVPSDDYLFLDESWKYKSFSKCMNRFVKGNDPDVDKVIDVITGIQNILRKNNIDVDLLDEEEEL